MKPRFKVGDEIFLISPTTDNPSQLFLTKMVIEDVVFNDPIWNKLYPDRAVYIEGGWDQGEHRTSAPEHLSFTKEEALQKFNEWLSETK